VEQHVTQDARTSTVALAPSSASLEGSVRFGLGLAFRPGNAFCSEDDAAAVCMH